MQSLPQKTEQEKGGEGFTVVWVWIINEAAFPNIMKTKQKKKTQKTERTTLVNGYRKEGWLLSLKI